MPRVAVILSGCGFQDGAEISESVITLLALDRADAEVTCLAPDVAQHRVIDHATGEAAGEPRNVLVEAARIARGKVSDIAAASVDDFDAVIMPGGFGAALNLSSFALEGSDGTVLDSVAAFLRAAHAAGKPIGAICIAPAVVALALGAESPRLTIGDDAGTAEALEACGARHTDCAVDAFCVDEENRIVSAPAYMFDARIKDVAAGIEKAVAEVLRMCS